MARWAVGLALLCSITLFGFADCSVGLCYGIQGDNLPPPNEVVALFQQYKISRMRLYSPLSSILSALRGSNISLILDVPQEDLSLLSHNQSAAEQWVDANVVPFVPDVQFHCLAVGNNLIPHDPQVGHILTGMKNLHNALASRNLDNIRISTVVDMSVLTSSYPPSTAQITTEALTYLKPITEFLQTNDYPLLLNLYPYFSYLGNAGDITLDYALFKSPQVVVVDGKFNYWNLFDASIDSLYAALEKINAGGLEIVVSETGWPSDGGDATNLDNAQTYNQNLVRHVHRGTPKRPSKEVETYLYNTFNENRKKPSTELNFGLFYPSKKPIYPIEFSGIDGDLDVSEGFSKGTDKYPVIFFIVLGVVFYF